MLFPRGGSEERTALQGQERIAGCSQKRSFTHLDQEKNSEAEKKMIRV